MTVCSFCPDGREYDSQYCSIDLFAFVDDLFIYVGIEREKPVMDSMSLLVIFNLSYSNFSNYLTHKLCDKMVSRVVL